MTIVVDTSVIVKWHSVEEGHIQALSLLNKNTRLVCPDFAFAEIANVLRRKVRTGEISSEQAVGSLEKLPKYFNLIVPMTELLEASFALATQIDHSVYDCVFLALARRENGSVLVTSDAVFLKKCIKAGFSKTVRSLDDYAVVAQGKSETSNG